MKKILLFFTFIFLINLVSSFSLEASPDELFLETTPGQKVCGTLNIKVSEESTLAIIDRWAEEDYKEKILAKHNLNSEFLEIRIGYPTTKTIHSEDKISVCVTPKNSGNFHGVLLIKGEDSSAGVGVWINLNSSKKETIFTGLAITNQNNKKPYILYGALLFVIIVLIEIWILIRNNH